MVKRLWLVVSCLLLVVVLVGEPKLPVSELLESEWPWAQEYGRPTWIFFDPPSSFSFELVLDPEEVMR